MRQPDSPTADSGGAPPPAAAAVDLEIDGDSETLSLDDQVELLRRMLLIRGFEERVARLYRNGEVPGFVHLSIGQEATAVGACWPLKDEDSITSTHRGHGHCLAKGLDPNSMMAELLAKDTGTNRGRGGSMHIADPRMGILGANGIVGAGLPIAVGAALAGRIRGEQDVVVAFFGDGASAQGYFHEAVNLASLWRLPVVFFCENNGFAEFSPAAAQHPVGLRERAAGYGVRYVHVDGTSAIEVATTMSQVVNHLRRGGGPVLVEATTHRWHGHYEGDPQSYRDADALDEVRKLHDPIAILRARLEAEGFDPSRLDELAASIGTQLDQAVELARAAPSPDPSELGAFVVAERPVVPEPPAPDPEGKLFRLMDAVHDALELELATDERVLVAGIDVGEGGNVFGLTRGLRERFGDRVLDTPISEAAIVGLGVGAAMAGMRPVVEVMYLDFIGVCLDQIMNQAAKLRFMTGGGAEMALTIRTQFGAGRSSGSQHSQSLEALLAHIPGLTVVMPSNPSDTYGLLRSAMADPNPVIFIENRLLYGMKGPRPPADHLVPIGRAAVVRPGSAVTVVSISRMVNECLRAAEELAAEGIDVEVIDLRTVVPLDVETVISSVSKTSRLLIAHEAVQSFGIGAEVAARVADEAFWHLDAPIARVGAEATPAPYAPSLEKAWLPDSTRIADAVRRLAAV